ncbi:HU family DNA-binding protein [Shimia abyssi]|uniref:HU family DNA-binding protein n=1 Tax=Shimia abyssi TaxID=1662395 RepID=UPI001FAFC9D4|nr:HU family DNA-binding protein [Shimia abyssi]
MSETVDVVAGPELKKPELIDLVVERSGIKKRFAKPTIEAALAVLGEALAEGRTLNLKPMGKAKVQKSKEIARGRVLSLRMRQQNAAGTESDSDPLAEAAE